MKETGVRKEAKVILRETIFIRSGEKFLNKTVREGNKNHPQKQWDGIRDIQKTVNFVKIFEDVLHFQEEIIQDWGTAKGCQAAKKLSN